MEKVVGKSCSNGLAIGKIRYWNRNKISVTKLAITNVDVELERFSDAIEAVKREIRELHKRVKNKLDPKEADIFGVYSLILEDEETISSICERVSKDHVNVEYAIQEHRDSVVEKMSSTCEETFISRAEDIIDIYDRIIRILGRGIEVIDLNEPVILATQELMPSELMRLQKKNILGLVLKRGSTYAHTSILARSLGLPLICGVEIDENWHGRTAVLEAGCGEFYIDPDEETISKIQSVKENDGIFDTWKKVSQISSSSGSRIKLYANIDKKEDVRFALENGAQGIGLFRTEMTYLGKDNFPTEDELFSEYKYVAEAMMGRQVIIRTIDIGEDKIPSYINIGRDKCLDDSDRGIKFCLNNPEIFKAQLRAILRAAVYGNICMMYPVVTDVSEIEAADKLLAEVEQELGDSELKYHIPPRGIMVETDLAVKNSVKLAEKVNFFSIGTNDLYRSGYTDEKILEMIKSVTANATKAGISVGICGEMAKNAEYTSVFAEMGIDYISAI